MDQGALQNLIEKSLEKGHTYSEYLTLISTLLAEGKSTALENSEDLTQYSELNLRRMRRWDKRFKASPAMQEKIKHVGRKINWLVISEGWCGDAAHSVPVMAKLAELNPLISVRIVLRDQNEQLMEQFLTNGGKSIPKLIAYDSEAKKVIGTWGPRPAETQQIVDDYKAKHGSLDDALKEHLQVWYNKNKGASIAEELSALIA